MASWMARMFAYEDAQTSIATDISARPSPRSFSKRTGLDVPTPILNGGSIAFALK
jgi:hypothetical protein